MSVCTANVSSVSLTEEYDICRDVRKADRQSADVESQSDSDVDMGDIGTGGNGKTNRGNETPSSNDVADIE